MTQDPAAPPGKRVGRRQRPLLDPARRPPAGPVATAYARAIVRMRWWVVGGWVAIVAALVALAPGFGAGGDQIASVITMDNPAIQAELRSVQEFGFPLSSRIVVVQHDPAGLSVFTQAKSVLKAAAADQNPQPYPLLGALPVTNTLGLMPFAAERNTAVLTYLFTDPRSSLAQQQEAAQRYIADNLDSPTDHVVGVAGSVPARAEQARLVTQYLPRLELLTVLAIIVLVMVNFRSVVAPLLALVTSATAFVLTERIAGVAGTLFGIAVPADLEPLLVALLLGVVTDYTIFYVSAFESRLETHQRWREAATAAVASFTPIVVAAGVTVATGTAALLAARSAFFRGFGPAMALAVLVSLVVSVTLIPALLAILGRLVFWPSRPGPRRAPVEMPGPAPSRLARRLYRGRGIEYLTRRPVAAAVLAVCVGLLLLAAGPIRGLDLGVGFTQSLPSSNPVREAASAASAGFAPGITSPTTLLIEGPRVTAQKEALVRLQRSLERQPGVAGVLGPAQNFTQREFNIVLARSGNAARMLVVFSHDPLEAVAIDDLDHLNAALPRLVHDSGLHGVTVSLAGDTALAAELVGMTGRDLGRIAVVGILVNLLLLVLFLRALVAPVYLLASSVLALAAALGVTVWVFQTLGGNEGLTFYVPFAAAVLLVSLGSDYNIFGVGHVWEESRTRSLREAIMVAVPETTRAISAAGLTLAVSFGLLAIIPLRPFQELALAMAVGILLDAMVVRALVMPCLLTLVGSASGWPGPHFRRSERDPRRRRPRAGGRAAPPPGAGRPGGGGGRTSAAANATPGAAGPGRWPARPPRAVPRRPGG